jgi:uncharacterized protein
VSRIYWDSMLFVYMIEANPVFGAQTRSILNEMILRGDTLCTSVFSIGEVLTGPRKRGSQSTVDAMKRFFASGNVEVLPFTKEAADRYSIIRAANRVGQADGIHLATAALAGADVFITNDAKLLRLQIPGIQFIVGLDTQLFGSPLP